MVFDFFKKKEEVVAPAIPDAPKKKKIERALVTGTFLLNTGCSFSGLTIGQEAERLVSAISADMNYSSPENKTVDQLEEIKKTPEFQRIHETIQKQGHSIDPIDLAAIFTFDKKSGIWKPMIKLSAWRSGDYKIGIRDPIKKLREYGIRTEDFAEAVIATNGLLSKMTGLTVTATLKPADTYMTIQRVEAWGAAAPAGDRAHDDRVGDVVDNQGKYIEILLKNILKDIPGGFSSLASESKKEILVFLIAHETLHHLAFPGHIPGNGRSLMNAAFPPMKTEEIIYQGKKQYRILWPFGKPTLEQDPASIICRTGLFSLFKEGILDERVKKTKK